MSQIHKSHFRVGNIKNATMKKIFFCGMFSFLCAPAFAKCHSNNLSPVVSLMAERASIMKAVAANKWYNTPKHQAVAYSAKQEIHVLNQAYNIAKENKLDPLSVMIFSQIQMDISKQIETYWINYWNNPKVSSKNKPSKQSIESLSTLRIKIGKIDAKFYPRLSANIPSIQQCSINQMIPIFHHAFTGVVGIPKKPSYINMLAKTFKNVSHL